MLKLQDLSLRSSKKPKTPEQLECMHRLLKHAVKGCRSEERRVGKECRSLCDWSSDVCSSDLYAEAAGPQPSLLKKAENTGTTGMHAPLAEARGEGLQIGRASCRERV